jgi:hypothetical protein
VAIAGALQGCAPLTLAQRIFVRTGLWRFGFGQDYINRNRQCGTRSALLRRV